jgi:hypothetical protein
MVLVLGLIIGVGLGVVIDLGLLIGIVAYDF